MKSTTGIVRKIDHLGRIVIPKEICRTLQIVPGTPLEISLEGRTIQITRHETACIFCDSQEELTVFGGRPVCKCCCEKISAL